MYKNVKFNIYTENLEDVVYRNFEMLDQRKINQNNKDNTEKFSASENKPIPKFGRGFWNDSLNYRGTK